MLRKLWGWKSRAKARRAANAKEKAGHLFASGLNCAQSVLQATTGIDSPEMMRMAAAFGGGIGDRKCLCGAISGGVMALGMEHKGEKSGELVDAFKARNRVTCCIALSRPYTWNSKEHRANCRRITEETAEMVEKLLKE